MYDLMIQDKRYKIMRFFGTLYGIPYTDFEPLLSIQDVDQAYQSSEHGYLNEMIVILDDTIRERIIARNHPEETLSSYERNRS